jgi:hypothetical protein
MELIIGYQVLHQMDQQVWKLGTINKTKSNTKVELKYSNGTVAVVQLTPNDKIEKKWTQKSYTLEKLKGTTFAPILIKQKSSDTHDKIGRPTGSKNKTYSMFIEV